MKQRTQSSGLMTVNEASRFLRISRSKLYMLMRDAELPYVTFGKSRRVSVSDLLALIEANKHNG